MKASKTLYIAILFFTIIASLSLTALRTVALITEYDAVENYFVHGAVIPAYFGWGAVAVIAVLFGALLSIRRSLSEIRPSSDSSVVIFTSALISFMIVAVFIFGLFSMGDSPSYLRLATVVLAVPAALYPLIGIALPVRSKNGQIMLSVFFLLWLFTVVISVYFEGTTAINDPNRMLELTAVSAALLFFLFECRYTVGTERPFIYIFLGLSSVAVIGMYTLPNVILAVMKLYPTQLDVTFEFILAAIWIYILLRMCIYAESVGETNVEDSGDNADDDSELSADEE